MTINQLREVYESRPFRPFTIQLADGREVAVPHPEFMWFHPKNPRVIFVGLPNGAARLIDLMLVTSVELSNGAAPRKRKR